MSDDGQRQARFGIAMDGSRHEMKRWIVAELMKVQTLYEDQGLEIRMEEIPGLFDGFYVLLRMPGREIHKIPVSHLPGERFQYSAIEDLIHQIDEWVGPPQVEASEVAYLPPGVE